MRPHRPTVLLLGGGDLGSGVAHALFRAQVAVVIVELAIPLAVRRRVAFSEAARHGEVVVENVCCRHVGLATLLRQPGLGDAVPLVTEPWVEVMERLAPDVVVDARMLKRRLQPRPPAPIFCVALGPGHAAGADCDVVVETVRGPDMGRVIRHGSATADTGVPGNVGGATQSRVLRAPCDGRLHVRAPIGTTVRHGDCVARVGTSEVRTPLAGVVRGMLADGDVVRAGQKLGDVDPRPNAPALDAISDKARVVGRAVVGVLGARFGFDPL